MASAPPPRPTHRLESIGRWLLWALAPRRPALEHTAPPAELAPWEEISIPRGLGGTLAGTWFPATGPVRGAVLLLHPWMAAGRAYFHRRGRIEALRAAGYAALAADFSGFGTSSPPAGFADRDVDDALAALAVRAPGVPLYVWGVSQGGYWAHAALARRSDVAGAMFEDVSAHLIEWSWRAAPWGRPFYLLYRYALPACYHYLDMRRHAAALRISAVTYVSGALDRAVLPEDTERFAALSGGRASIIPGAQHLGAIKIAPDQVIALALATFGGG